MFRFLLRLLACLTPASGSARRYARAAWRPLLALLVLALPLLVLGSKVSLGNGAPPSNPAVDASIDGIGVGIINTSADKQEEIQQVAPGGGATFLIKIQCSNYASTDTLKVSTSAWNKFASNGWSGKFFDSAAGGNDITAAITGGGWSPPSVSDTVTLRAQVSVPAAAKGPYSASFVLTSSLGSASDAVKATINLPAPPTPTPTPTPSPTPLPPPPGDPLFGSGPSNGGHDNNSFELGMKFQCLVPGMATGVRYYKTSGETGNHTGHLWDAGGKSLASVSFSGESDSGWQVATLSSSVHLSTGMIYTVSVNANTAHPSDPGGLAQPISNGSIVSVADGSNGVFNSTMGQFPSAHQDSNYYRDVFFVPDTTGGGGTGGGGTGGGGTGGGGTGGGGTGGGGTGGGGTGGGGTGGGGQQQSQLNATAISSHRIDLSWSPAAGKLYRSTQKDFTPDDSTNLIFTSDGKTSTLSDTGLTGATTYSYIFRPSSPGYSDGKTNCTTLQKKWDPGDALSGGDVLKPQNSDQYDPLHPLIVTQNSTLDLEVAGASDTDHWVDGPDEGNEPDKTITTKWTAPQGVFSAADQSATQWTAPPLPEGADKIDFSIKVTIKDNPAPVALPDLGTRQDDKPITHDIYVSLRRPKWSATPDIGQHRDLVTNQLVPDGRMIAPQDQRGNYNSSEQQVVVSGARIPCEVEGATDLDTLTAIDGTTSEAQDEVNYTWSAKRSGDQGSDPGHFEWQDTDANGQPITKTGQTAPTTKAVWVAPSDVTKDTQFKLKCTIDDKPLLPNSPAEGGTRDDKALERTVSLKGQDFRVSFDGLARACAGGIAVDGVHSFTITGTANKTDGSLAPNTQFKLSFDGNKGHDYEDGRDKKTAKFVTVDANGVQQLVENYTTHSDDKGQFAVTVLSSDVISQDIKIKVKHTNAEGQDTDAGSQACNFAAAEGYRDFDDPFNSDPDHDYGWLFNRAWLGGTGTTTTAKIYFKFKINNGGGDLRRNWVPVNGHHINITVSKVILFDGTTASSNGRYVKVIATSSERIDANSVTIGDGAATVLVKAGKKVSDAELILFDASDQSQWEK